MSEPQRLHPDVLLALYAIAAALGVEVDDIPHGVSGVLTAFGAARYGDGCRESLAAMGVDRPKNDDTPVVRKLPSGVRRNGK